MIHKFIKVVLLFLAFLLLTSCAKTPESVISPSLSVKPGDNGDNETLVFMFTGGLKNENESTVFLNVKGEVTISDNSGKTFLVIPFELPSILPFETGIIQSRVIKSPAEVQPVISDLNIDVKKLFEKGEPENLFPDEEKVKLKSLVLEKKGIVEVLKGKIK